MKPFRKNVAIAVDGGGIKGEDWNRWGRWAHRWDRWRSCLSVISVLQRVQRLIVATPIVGVQGV